MRRNHILRTSVALAAVTALLAACSENDTDNPDNADNPGNAETSRSSSQAPTDESSAPIEPAVLPEGVLALPARNPGESAVTLDTGRYRVPLDDTLAFDIDVPGPTYAHDDGVFLATGPVVVKTEIAAEQYGVPRDPCTDPAIEPVGPATADLVEAIKNQPTYQTTRPVPVELEGAAGTYLEIRIPATYDDSKCADKIVMPTNPDTAVGFDPGYRSRWWILDVDGRRVVIQQNCICSADRLDRAATIAESITFTPAS